MIIRILSSWSAVLVGLFLATSPIFAQELPEGEGKDLVADVCSRCHGLGNTTNSRFTKEEWRNVALDMDVPLSDAELDTLAEYLGKNFGPESSSKNEERPTNINKASAKELESNLGLSADEADGIIAYREQHGSFKEWEDLKKVPGLSAEKIEKIKGRLSF